MKRLVIDTDPGIDDALAILMAYMHPDTHIEAITTVAGNVGLDKTTANALKILDVLGADDIPVYPGADGALVERVPDASEVHGNDGLGNANLPTPSRDPENEHAALALVRLANENPRELDLIAIGPLTNLALATRIDPDLPNKYKSLVIMAGTIYGQGNTQNIAAEFNVYADPEAASIVIDTWSGLTMISWETTMAHGFTLEEHRKLLSYNNPRSELIKKITTNLYALLIEKFNREEAYAADPLAMSVCLEADIVTKAGKFPVHVERMGRASRGMTVVDWQNFGGKQPNVNLVLEVDKKRFYDLLLEAVS
jgi:purine nucleosidase